MNEKYAYTMVDLMMGVTKFGTASGELRKSWYSCYKLKLLVKRVLLKIIRDGWFMGITPKSSNGRLGRLGRYKQPTSTSTGEGQGARMALPIWGIFMKEKFGQIKNSRNFALKDKFTKTF